MLIWVFHITYFYIWEECVISSYIYIYIYIFFFYGHCISQAQHIAIWELGEFGLQSNQAMDQTIQGLIHGWGNIFCVPQLLDWHWGLPGLLFNGYQQCFPQGIKWPSSEGDHSPPSSATLSMCGITLLCTLMPSWPAWKQL